MKYKIIILILLTLFGIDSILLANNCTESDIKKIRKNIPLKNYRIISKRKTNDICEAIIKMDGGLFPFYVVGDAVFSGDMWLNKKNITSAHIRKVKQGEFLKYRDRIDSLVAFTYIPAKVKIRRVIYFVTEPLCPYCHEAGKSLIVMADKYGFKVNVIFLTMHGDEGKKKCVEAFCRNIKSENRFNLKEYNDSSWKKKPALKEYLCKKGYENLRKTEKLSEKLGIDGVPFFYNDLGNAVEGADMKGVLKLIRDK